MGLGADQMSQMSAAMSSPWVQQMLSNPDVMRGLIQSDPTLRAMAEANPEVNQVLNDPATMAQMSRVMANPQLMREYMRGMDRQMSNIESMPGGFAAMQRMHAQLDAADAQQQDAPAAPPADNPFAAMFQGGAAAAPGAGDGAAPAASPGVGGGPNSAPLPNPWAPAAAGAAGGAPAGLPAGLPAGFPGMGAAGAGGMGDLLGPGADPLTLINSPFFESFISSAAQNPAMMEMMMSQMRSALEADPRLAAAPQARAMLDNPDAMRSMIQAMADPQGRAALTQMSTAMRQLEGTPLGGMFGAPAGLGGSGVGGGGAGTGAGGAAMPDLSALMNIVGGEDVYVHGGIAYMKQCTRYY
jgi:ubiquilin